MSTKKIGPEHDKDWSEKVWKIRQFTQVEQRYAHEALMYYDGDEQLCISEIISDVYVPKDGRPKQASDSTYINTVNDKPINHVT